MTKRIISFIALMMIVSLSLCAQDRMPCNMPTPGSTAICSYGNIPVSYYSGAPNITIPLHKFSCRGVDLPVYLSYNASGVLLNLLPSWTGENWSLHAGGCITRTINGYPDELVAPSAVQNPVTFHNYFESYDTIAYFAVEHMAQLGSVIQDEETEFWDMDPDVFHFNFMGHSGAFFLGNDGQWKVAGDEDFDVIFDVANYPSQLIDPFINKFPCKELGYEYGTQPKVIKGFKLRDTNGTEYEFGFDESAIEYTTPLVQTAYEKVFSWFAVSWYLTKVTDRLGNVLYTLNYERGKFLANISRAYYSDNIESSSSFNNLWHTINYTDRYENVGNAIFPYYGELESPVYLTSISASDGTHAGFSSDYDGPTSADLYPSLHNAASYSQWRDMSGVDYVTGDSKCIYYLQTGFDVAPQYQYQPNNNSLNYSDSILARTRMKVLRSVYFSDSAVSAAKSIGFELVYNSDQSRMHLISLRQYCRGITGGKMYIKKHEFLYDHYEKLPCNYVTHKVDHWGYCRQIADNQDNMLSMEQMPTTEASKISYRHTKNPNQTNVKFGTLTKILYPTGGACVIEYEPNSFVGYRNEARDAMVDSIGIGGGVRVKSIAEYNDSACTQLLSKRNFSYSGGELFCKPIYYWPQCSLMNIANGSISVSSFRTCSIVPLSNSFCPSVGYSTVTETRLDGAKTIRHYKNFSNSTNDELSSSFNNGLSPFDRFTEYSYMRGRLLCEEYYDAAGNKVRGIGYTYGNDNTSDRVWASNLRVYWGSNTAAYKGRIYSFVYSRYNIVTAQDTTYGQSGSTYGVIQTSYNRTYHNINLTSPYNRTQRVCRLNYELTARGSNSIKTAYTYRIDTDSLTSHFYLKPVAIRHYRNGVFTGGDSISYALFNVNGSRLLLKSSEIKLYSDGSHESVVTYNNYTLTGRPLVISIKGLPDKHLCWVNNDNYLAITSEGNNLSSPKHYMPDIYAFNLNSAFEFAQTSIPNINSPLNLNSGRCVFYVYDSLGNVIAVINADGTITKYNRDRSERITDILDTNERLMRHFEYNYQYK